MSPFDIRIIESCGAAVTAFKPGNRVLISCISACGKCGPFPFVVGKGTQAQGR
jgi:hypothetical protein